MPDKYEVEGVNSYDPRVIEHDYFEIFTKICAFLIALGIVILSLW